MATDLLVVTHVAGPIIKIGDRVIQRCPICGDKLADSHSQSGERVPFVEADLIRISDGEPQVIGDFLGKKKLPKSLCLNLVEK